MLFVARMSLLLVAVPLLVACAESQTVAPATHAAGSDGPTVTSGDQDAHGCIESAGYSWCAKEKDCVRPWELASSKSLGEGREAFDRYCGH
jgi:hypothetical protein